MLVCPNKQTSSRHTHAHSLQHDCERESAILYVGVVEKGSGIAVQDIVNNYED